MLRELCGRLRDDAARPAESTMLNAIIIGSLIEVFTIPLFGYISDIVGRRPLYFAGAIFTILFAFPLFWLFDTKNALVIGATVAVAISFGHGLMFGLLSTYLPELFGKRCAIPAPRSASRSPRRSAVVSLRSFDLADAIIRRHDGRLGSVDRARLDHLHRNALRPRDARRAALTSCLHADRTRRELRAADGASPAVDILTVAIRRSDIDGR